MLDGVLALADGRALAFTSWGRDDGPLVLLCHPSTRAAVGWDAADAAGVRIVFPDRPGFGRSTFQPGSSILGWTADVAALLDHLGIERCWVAGVSAATPYALACGVALAERVEAIGIIAGSVPPPAPGAGAPPSGMVALARSDPEAAFAAITAEREVVDHEEGARRVLARPEPDGSLYGRPDIQAALVAASHETYRQGPAGPSWDTVLRLRPWGFGLGDVTAPCRWWHGADDAVVPRARIEEATAGLPRHSLRVVDGAGHGVCITHVEPFLRELTTNR